MYVGIQHKLKKNAATRSEYSGNPPTKTDKFTLNIKVT